jgi:hypothetical protein
LWRGVDINAKSPPKVAWEMVCLPKFEGVGNDALLLKDLNKFFNKADIPWLQLVWGKYYINGKLPIHIKKGSFWWKDVLKLLDSFKGFSFSYSWWRYMILRHDLWAGQVPS